MPTRDTDMGLLTRDTEMGLLNSTGRECERNPESDCEDVEDFEVFITKRT